MNKDSVTLVTLEYPPKRGGVARYLSELVTAAQGRIRVVAQREGGDLSHPRDVETAEFFGPGWPAWRPLIWMCRRERERSRFIFVSHVFPVGTAAWISRMLHGPEYTILLHGLDVRMVTGWWKKCLFALICRDARAVFVNSESTKRDVAKLVPGQTVCVLTPGIRDEGYVMRDEARTRLGIESSTELVVSIGRLVPRKGIDFSLRAISRIQSKRNVMYVVIGDGPDAERLEGIANEVRTRVRWIRDASDEETRTWLAAADLFLLPVREDDRDVEGFGIVYLEAALAGIPSVAGRSGGAAEAVLHDQTGLLVHPHRIEEIEAAIVRLLDDVSLRDQFGLNGRLRALSEFRWKDRWEIVRRVLDLDR
jgi:phosphatidylinositol alpha-1,6-mannosyltransferase